MRLPIGYDIFKELIDNKLDFIDKSLFIKEILDDEAKIILLTRPRRFGKTLNLSMLHHFLAAVAYNQYTQGIFDNLQIAKVDQGKYMQYQGKYPVIFVTYKDVKNHKFQTAYSALCTLMSEIYSEHQYLQASEKLSDADKKNFNNILTGEAEQSIIENSLKLLCKYLQDHFGVKPWLLIDEYNTPIQAGYIHGYYDEIIDFMRGMFGAALKTNPYLHKAVITGILRISKESLFSGLNNIEVYSVLQNEYSRYFGFTEEEVNYILQQTNLEAKAKRIKDWYNGYQFGNTVVYNPWSIVNCVKKQGKISPYWVNTSGNDLVRNLVVNSPLNFKEQFEILMQGNSIENAIDEHVTFGDLQLNEDAIWSMLVASGYLKVVATEYTDQGFKCTLDIPNKEVLSLYRQMIKQWLSSGKSTSWYNQFLENLLQGKIAEFAEDLKDVMLQIVSVHDVAKEPEAFYHGLMLGLTASLDPKQYAIKSNKESGLGRYDIVIIPYDINQQAIILELKRAKSKWRLERAAQTALIQIETLNYISEIKQRGIKNLTQIGLAFYGKEFRIKAKSNGKE
jgi:hypothetical protein